MDKKTKSVIDFLETFRTEKDRLNYLEKIR